VDKYVIEFRGLFDKERVTAALDDLKFCAGNLRRKVSRILHRNDDVRIATQHERRAPNRFKPRLRIETHCRLQLAQINMLGHFIRRTQMNDAIDLIALRLHVLRRECEQQVRPHSLFAVESLRRSYRLQCLRRGHDVIWPTKARAAKHQLARHRRILEYKLLSDEAAKRSAHDMRTLDADCL